MKLEISLFRFDAATDYLPYYTKYFIKIKDEKNLLDIFKTINKKEPFDFIDDGKSGVVINEIFTTLDISIEDINTNFGKEIVLKPISTRRAYKDFLINEDDFYDKLKLIENHTISNEQKIKYEEYKLYFYASNTLLINKNYIGDAFILLAEELLLKENVKHQIEALLNDKKNGAIFHTSLSNRIFNFDETIEHKIKTMQKNLKITQEKSKQNFNSKDANKFNFDEICEFKDIKHSFKDFNLAYYVGPNNKNSNKSLIDSLEANFLNLHSLKDDLSLDTFHINPEFTYKLTAKMLLDVYDSGADLLIVPNSEIFHLINSNMQELKRVSRRDINLPILHINEVIKLANGEFCGLEEQLKLHAIDPCII